MNSNALASWHRSISKIIDRKCDDSALEELVTALEKLIQGSSSSLLVFPSGQPPYCLYNRLQAHEDPHTHLNSYVDAAYVLDPFYLKGHDDNAEGILTLSEVVPNGFESSEFYRLYYHAIDLYDEVCLLFQLRNDSGFALISLGRHSHEEAFDKNTIILLENIFPLAKSIINAWTVNTDTRSAPSLKDQLNTALDRFGSSVLTKRECLITQLMLQGHSNQSIAEKLGNSIETIKHHRKKIYTKLDIGTQMELFNLFISALRCASPDLDIDPLAAYSSQ